jgi:PKD repeat protein
VYFTGSASGGSSPYSYRWTFGDGGSSTSQNPSHTYSAAGNYTATLTVTDDSSANASATAGVSVGTVKTTVGLALAVETGAPARGPGGTTKPSPGNYNFSAGSTASVTSVPNTDYRFSRWSGDIATSKIFSSTTSLLMDNDKSLLATFCTKCADVNGDLSITPADAQMAFDIYLKRIAEPTWCELENADVNSSGTKLNPKITPADAQMIFNKYLKKATVDGSCSGSSRVAAAAGQNLTLPAVKLAVNSSAFNQDGYLYVPIIVESASDIGAFGFDLAFSPGWLTYVGLERTELTSDFDQLDANVIPNPTSPEGSTLGGFSSFGLPAGFEAQGKPSEGFDQQPVDTPKGLILRVGGYKSSLTGKSCSGVLVTLVFRVTGEVGDPDSISIIATYDDIQNASILDGPPRDNRRGTERPAGKPSPEKKAAGKRYDF